jgi:hypothetical protein
MPFGNCLGFDENQRICPSRTYAAKCSPKVAIRVSQSGSSHLAFINAKLLPKGEVFEAKIVLGFEQRSDEPDSKYDDYTKHVWMLLNCAVGCKEKDVSTGGFLGRRGLLKNY